MRRSVSCLPLEGFFGRVTHRSFVCTRCQQSVIRPTLARYQSNKPSSKSSMIKLRQALNDKSDPETVGEVVTQAFQEIKDVKNEVKDAIKQGGLPHAVGVADRRLQEVVRKKERLERSEEIRKNRERLTQSSDAENVGGYVPAKTWDGLERLGGPRGWWEAEWDLANQFRGFMPPTKIDDVAIEGTVRRAMIEVLTLKQVELPLTQATNAWEHTTFDYGQVELDCEHGEPVLRFEDDAVRIELLSTMAEEPNPEASAEELTAEELQHEELEETTEPADAEQDSVSRGGPISLEAANWHNISLKDDLELKFAVFKRVMQLTGARIPDPVMQQIDTAGDLINHLLTKPKAAKLAEILLANPELASLPNVEIYESRRTPIDKEKELGRWKVIEKELRERNLPVTGHAQKERL